MPRPRIEQVLYGVSAAGMAGAICLIGHDLISDENQKLANTYVKLSDQAHTGQTPSWERMDSVNVEVKPDAIAAQPYEWQAHWALGALGVAVVSGVAGLTIEESRRYQTGSLVSTNS